MKFARNVIIMHLFISKIEEDNDKHKHLKQKQNSKKIQSN